METSVAIEPRPLSLLRRLTSWFRPPGEPLTCREMVELVTAYLEDTLSRRDRLRFEWHISRCDGCPIYLEQLRVTLVTLRGISEETLDPAARDELLHAFHDWRREPPPNQ